MDKCHYWHIGSMGCKDLPQNIRGSVTYISGSSDSVLNLEDYLMDECCTGDTQGMGRGIHVLGHISSL